MDLTVNVLTIFRTMPPIFSDDLFDRADKIEQLELQRHVVTSSFGPNEAVFKQGASPANVLIMRSGTAVLSRRPFDHIVCAGQVVGLTETLARIPFDTTLRTVSACTFERIDHDDLIALLHARPKILHRMLDVLSRKCGNELLDQAGFGLCDLSHIPANRAGIEWECKSITPRNISN